MLRVRNIKVVYQETSKTIEVWHSAAFSRQAQAVKYTKKNREGVFELNFKLWKGLARKVKIFILLTLLKNS